MEDSKTNELIDKVIAETLSDLESQSLIGLTIEQKAEIFSDHLLKQCIPYSEVVDFMQLINQKLTEGLKKRATSLVNEANGINEAIKIMAKRKC
jgi:hypothetical protein